MEHFTDPWTDHIHEWFRGFLIVGRDMDRSINCRELAESWYETVGTILLYTPAQKS